MNSYQKGLAFLLKMCMNMQWYKAEEKNNNLEVSDLRLLDFLFLKTYLTLQWCVSKLDLGNSFPKRSNYGSYVYSAIH